jgi:large subunit ribosomal protein L15
LVFLSFVFSVFAFVGNGFQLQSSIPILPAYSLSHSNPLNIPRSPVLNNNNEPQLQQSQLGRNRGLNLYMKLFDWKRREALHQLKLPPDYMPFEHNLFNAPGSVKRKQRVGRGIAAGQGESCGRGMKGAKSRKGPGPYKNFEGGQTPKSRQKSKTRISKNLKPDYILIKIEYLNQHFSSNDEVNEKILFNKGLLGKGIKKRKDFKILSGNIECIHKNLTVKAHAFTASARKTIEEKGGKCIIMSKTRRHLTEEENKVIKKVISDENYEKLKILRKLRREKRIIAREKIKAQEEAEKLRIQQLQKSSQPMKEESHPFGKYELKEHKNETLIIAAPDVKRYVKKKVRAARKKKEKKKKK